MNKPELGSLLVVDDNEMNRDMLSRRLQRESYRVVVASGGQEALERVAEEKFDLILLDVEMPDLSGFEVLALIREKYSLAELPVIMATARDSSQDMVAGFRSGANDYVTKPIDFAVLLMRVQTQLQLKALTQLKDQFLQIASHDLKNPLGNILMAADLVLAIVKPGETMTEDMYQTLDVITKQCKTMQRIITDFLDFQALQDGHLQIKRKPTQINLLAQMAVERNSDYALSKQIGLNLALGDDLPPIMADDARLEQVIQNFVGNAIKFCPPEAAVTVSTRLEDHSVWIGVSDSGPGLTDADLQKVFTKYARLSNKPTGSEKSSGLGLAICKQIIDAHGGNIGVYNNPDRGATFWFRLPIEATS